MDIVSKANRLERPKLSSIPINPAVYHSVRRVLADLFYQCLSADQESEGVDQEVAGDE